MRVGLRFWLVLGGATVLSAAGAAFGDWWIAFAAGLAAGILLPSARQAIAAGAASGLLGWAIPLIYLQFTYGLGPTATVLAGILGVAGAQSGAVPVVLTCAIGLLLGLAGSWLASAAFALLPGRAARHETAATKP